MVKGMNREKKKDKEGEGVDAGVPVRIILINKSTNGQRTSNNNKKRINAHTPNAFINSIMNIAKILKLKNKIYGLANGRERRATV